MGGPWFVGGARPMIVATRAEGAEPLGEGAARSAAQAIVAFDARLAARIVESQSRRLLRGRSLRDPRFVAAELARLLAGGGLWVTPRPAATPAPSVGAAPPRPVPPAAPPKAKPGSGVWQLLRLEYPAFVAPGGEPEPVVIRWSLRDPAATLTEGALSVRGRVDGQERVLWSKALSVAELADGDHELPYEGEVRASAPFPLGHASAEASPYTLELSVGVGRRDETLRTRFEVRVTAISLSWGAATMVSRPRDRRLHARLVQEVDLLGTPAGAEVRLPSPPFPRTNADYQAPFGPQAPFARYHAQWGEGPSLPLLANVWFRNSVGDEVLAPRAWGRSRVRWSFTYTNVAPVGGVAGGWIAERADHRVAESVPQGRACHRDFGGKRNELGMGYFHSPAGRPFPEDAPLRRLGTRFTGPASRGDLRGRTGTLFVPGRQALDGHRVTAAFDPQRELDDPEANDPRFSVTSSSLFVRREVTIARQLVKRPDVAAFGAAALHRMAPLLEAGVVTRLEEPTVTPLDEAGFNAAVARALDGVATMVPREVLDALVDPALNQFQAGPAMLYLRTVEGFVQEAPAAMRAMTDDATTTYLMTLNLVLTFGNLWGRIVEELVRAIPPAAGITLVLFDGHTSADPLVASALASTPQKRKDPSHQGLTVPLGDPDRIAIALHSLDLRTLHHEVAHANHLFHAPARNPLDAGDAFELGPGKVVLHDMASRRCLMNYDPDDLQLCGFCQLILRGWDPRAVWAATANDAEGP